MESGKWKMENKKSYLKFSIFHFPFSISYVLKILALIRSAICSACCAIVVFASAA
jgi:hypothetical protein